MDCDLSVLLLWSLDGGGTRFVDSAGPDTDFRESKSGLRP